MAKSGEKYMISATNRPFVLPVGPRCICLVLNEHTIRYPRHSVILNNFWSRSNTLGQYQSNFDFILDHRRQRIFKCLINYYCIIPGSIMAPLFTAMSLYGSMTIVYIPCAIITLWLPVIFEVFVY